ncbi:MAG: SDR family oxidoreductase [Gemmatimonadetes bacterium]|nr:SDR family oxidoreductase [Gemmatimonadota bacterium]
MTLPRVALTGATGYIGGRLLRVLEERGYPVTCLVRRPGYLASRVTGTTRVLAADVLDEASLRAALEGTEAAFYLVHSLGTTRDFEQRETEGARNFAAAARACGVRRIVYLGGLGPEGPELSRHLRSRQTVGRILRESGVPTLELRASIVIGSGSVSFEIIRALAERLPVMVMPRWVSVQAQPIAIQDLVEYLVQSLHLELPESLVVEIGGADRLSYRDLIAEYARQRGLSRLMVPVPVLTPRLSSLWLGLVTPVYARVGRKLIDSIRTPSLVTNSLARDLFRVTPRGASQAIRAALRNEEREFAETSWWDSLSAGGNPAVGALDGGPFGGVRVGNRLVDSRQVRVGASPAETFRVVEALGGRTGWLAWSFLWRLRGALDLLVGGVGMRRGRPTGRPLRPGDALDFWRVESVERPRRLRLVAEMKLPGRAWLDFEVEETEGGSVLRQTAVFDPTGLSGLAYWYGVYPLHALVFGSMIQAIASRAHRSSGQVTGKLSGRIHEAHPHD